VTLQDRIASEALALLGVPFRLHGRSVATGLDCVGLVALAAERAGLHRPALPAYRLRGTGRAKAEQALLRCGLARVVDARGGDVLLVESGPMQLHLMIRAGEGFVHAHAGLGRVVLTPAPPASPAPWPLLGSWRFLPFSDQG